MAVEVVRDTARAKKFIREKGLTFTFLEEITGGQDSVNSAFNVQSYPTNVVIDRHGHVVKYDSGFIPVISLSGLESAIKKALVNEEH